LWGRLCKQRDGESEENEWNKTTALHFFSSYIFGRSSFVDLPRRPKKCLEVAREWTGANWGKKSGQRT
jgi:hypothetical protein